MSRSANRRRSIMRVLPSIPKLALCASSLLWGGLQLNGAERDQFPPLNEPPTAERLAGKFIWADLFTIDPTAAVKFYEGMFGWTATTFARWRVDLDGAFCEAAGSRVDVLSPRFQLRSDGRAGGGKEGSAVLAANGLARAGISPLPAGEDARPAWLGFVRMENTDRAASQASALGGRVLVTPRQSPLGSRFAVLADPVGAAIAVIEFNAPINPDSSR